MMIHELKTTDSFIISIETFLDSQWVKVVECEDYADALKRMEHLYKSVTGNYRVVKTTKKILCTIDHRGWDNEKPQQENAN